jgi:hypothetical protein
VLLILWWIGTDVLAEPVLALNACPDRLAAADAVDGSSDVQLTVMRR